LKPKDREIEGEEINQSIKVLFINNRTESLLFTVSYFFQEEIKGDSEPQRYNSCCIWYEFHHFVVLISFK